MIHTQIITSNLLRQHENKPLGNMKATQNQNSTQQKNTRKHNTNMNTFSLASGQYFKKHRYKLLLLPKLCLTVEFFYESKTVILL